LFNNGAELDAAEKNCAESGECFARFGFWVAVETVSIGILLLALSKITETSAFAEVLVLMLGLVVPVAIFTFTGFVYHGIEFVLSRMSVNVHHRHPA
jgi:hypothetical protein